MTDEKRKLIADAWCEVQQITMEKNVHERRIVTNVESLNNALSVILLKQAVWKKYGLLDDPDLDEWIENLDYYELNKFTL